MIVSLPQKHLRTMTSTLDLEISIADGNSPQKAGKRTSNLASNRTARDGSTTSATLVSLEIEEITGYRRPMDQLRELKRQGFHRARRSPTRGHVILERTHYEYICHGARTQNVPQVRIPKPLAKIK